MFKVLFFATLLAAAPSPQSDEFLKIPLPARRLLVRTDGDVNGPAYLTSLNNTLKKYHSNVVLPTYSGVNPQTAKLRNKRQSNEALKDQVDNGSTDELYYGDIDVGKVTPQTFTTDFDTGMENLFDLWLAANDQ